MKIFLCLLIFVAPYSLVTVMWLGISFVLFLVKNSCKEVLISVHVHLLNIYLFTCSIFLCPSSMSFQPEILPCRDDQSIVTNTLQINRYFIKQLWYKMRYSSFSKMCTTKLINNLDHSIKFAYFYPFIRIQEPFRLGKISQLDLNLLNQNPLLIGSLFVWDADFFLLLLLLLKPLLGLFFS